MIFETINTKRDENQNPIGYITYLYSDNSAKVRQEVCGIISTELTPSGWLSEYNINFRLPNGLFDYHNFITSIKVFKFAEDSIKDVIKTIIDDFTSSLNNFKIESDVNDNFIEKDIVKISETISGNLNGLFDYHIRLISIFEDFKKKRGIDILPKTIYQLIKDNSNFRVEITDTQTGHDLINRDTNFSVKEIKKCLLDEYWDRVEFYANDVKIYTLFHRDLVI